MNHLVLDPRVQVPAISPCAGRIFDEVADMFPETATRYLSHAFDRLKDVVETTTVTETQPIDVELVARLVEEEPTEEVQEDVLLVESTYFAGPIEEPAFERKSRPWVNKIKGAIRKVEHWLIKAQLIYRGEL